MEQSVKGQRGFSLTELIVALLVAMILMALGLPAFLRAYRAYELNNAATQVANILRLTRYEAIRQNTAIQCYVRPGPAPGTTNMWVDSVANGTLDPTEKMILLDPSGNLTDGGSVPGAASMLSTAVGSTPTNPQSATASSVKFDARGAVSPPTAVVVYYLSSAAAPDAGYRAVLLMPAGSMEIWTADTSGSWQQLR